MIKTYLTGAGSHSILSSRTQTYAFLVVLTALAVPINGRALAPAAPAPTIAIGEVALALPSPQRLIDPNSAAPQINDLTVTMVAPANRLLAIYIPELVLRNYLNGAELALERYAMAQTSKAADGPGTITPEQFVTFKAGMKQQQTPAALEKLEKSTKGLVEKAEKTIAEKAKNKTFGMSIANVKGMGVVEETNTSITVLGSMDYRSQLNGIKQGWPVVHGTTVVVVRGKPVFLYVYSPYKSKSDVKWVTETSLRWKDAIERAN